MKTAAIYARVSSERQKDEHTIVSQVAALTDYAKTTTYTVPEEWIFLDEGYSGSLLVRPGLERLRDLAAEGQIEAVLVYTPDRLSRKYAYQVLLMEEFSRHGVEVVFINSPQVSTPEEQLLLQFQGMFAEYERAQITERTRRGKRHRAKTGSVNVLSGAPYGYRYIKKTEHSVAYYEVLEGEAEVVRQVYRYYTEEGLSINRIARCLDEQGVPTRKGASRWCRSTVWGMLRNPAYRGTACYGKTEHVERQKITRPLRQRGGYSPRNSANRERPRTQWIEIPVPALIDEASFALAQERLAENKRLSPRRTVEPTLLQGMLVCHQCGYAYYRTSTRTSRKKIYYYRCLGSDNYRYANGRVCQSKPVRQDHLDKVVWSQVMLLLETPELIQVEITHRLDEIRRADPTQQRQTALRQELNRIEKRIEKLLDAYQENLLQLGELRQRMPELRKKAETLTLQLKHLSLAEVEQQAFLHVADNIEEFLSSLRLSSTTLDITDRQKILRLVVKEILVDNDTIKIRHSIPVTRTNPPVGPSTESKLPSYLLRSGSHDATLRRAA